MLLDAATRFVDHLMERPDGPMAFRFVLQPIMAAVIAVRDGLSDARTGAPPYFMTLIRPSGDRRAAWWEGLRATARIMVLAVVLDTIYQIFVFRAFYLGEALIIALVLGFLPYVVLRGPVSRFVRRRNASSARNK